MDIKGKHSPSSSLGFKTNLSNAISKISKEEKKRGCKGNKELF
jgi:hypothetical protein